MNIIIHDLEEKQFQALFPDVGEKAYIIADNHSIKNCIGCFGCWIKTPGQCILKDGYHELGKALAQAEKVIIISRLVYGGYSPFVKNVLDRSISYLLPFFVTKNNETHHKQRYQSTFCLSAFFYNDCITPKTMETAKALVKANSRNFYVKSSEVSFFKTLEQLGMECAV